jgi:hypothetical protein
MKYPKIIGIAVVIAVLFSVPALIGNHKKTHSPSETLRDAPSSRDALGSQGEWEGQINEISRQSKLSPKTDQDNVPGSRVGSALPQGAVVAPEGYILDQDGLISLSEKQQEKIAKLSRFIRMSKKNISDSYACEYQLEATSRLGNSHLITVIYDIRDVHSNCESENWERIVLSKYRPGLSYYLIQRPLGAGDYYRRDEAKEVALIYADASVRLTDVSARDKESDKRKRFDEELRFWLQYDIDK